MYPLIPWELFSDPLGFVEHTLETTHLDEPGFDTCQRQEYIFLLSKAFGQVLLSKAFGQDRSPSSLYSLCAKVLSMGAKQPGHDVGHSPQSSAKVKK